MAEAEQQFEDATVKLNEVNAICEVLNEKLGKLKAEYDEAEAEKN